MAFVAEVCVGEPASDVEETLFYCSKGQWSHGGEQQLYVVDEMSVIVRMFAKVGVGDCLFYNRALLL